MNESSETGTPGKKYWNWLTLVLLFVVAGALQLIPKQEFRARAAGSPDKAKIDIESIMQSLAEYAIDNEGSFPTSLAELVAPDNNGRSYLEGTNGTVPKDPWKRQYHYEFPTPAYPRPHVWTYGADGVPGGTGDNADIYNEPLKEEPR